MTEAADDYEKKFKNLLKNIPLFYIETDSRGKIIAFSSSVAVTTGYSDEELFSFCIFDLFSYETDAEFFSAFLNKEKEANRYEFTLSGKNKKEIILRTVSLEETSEKIFAFIAEDITSDAEYETTSIADIERLEQNIIRREKETENAWKELNNICAEISHEFIAPVRAIEEYSRIIEEKIKGMGFSSAERALSEINKYCRSSSDLVRNMIDYSKIRARTLVTERTDIRSIIISCLDDLKIIYRNTDIRAEVADLPEINCDRFLIRHAVYNILDNSVKYSSKKKYAEINISYTESDDEITVYFSDRGIGFDISSGMDPFALFCRHHPENEFKGSGIGLATVRKIIEKHNGSISIKAEKNKGCTVIISLKK